MTIRVGHEELQKTLTDQVAEFAAGPYQIALFKNDVVEGLEMSLGNFTLCDAGGYDGWQDLDDWGAVFWQSPRAKSEHTPIVWDFDGTSTNTVYGYVVRDGAGNYAWHEKRVGGGVVVGSFAGQTYTVFPVYTRRSEF